MTNFVDRETIITAPWLNHVDTTVDAAPIQSLSHVTISADKLAYYAGANTAAVTAFPAFGRSVVGCATASALAALLAGTTLTNITLAGTPVAPTAALHTNTTQVATTAFVVAEVASFTPDLSLYATIASPTFTGVPAAPTAAPGTNTTQLATTAFVLANAPAVDLSRLSLTPNVTYDLNGNGAAGTVLSTNILIKRSDTFVVPTGKETDLISFRPSLETQGTGNFTGINVQPIITTTDSSFNYAIIGSITATAGTGKTTGIYARAGTDGSYSGLLVGITCAITPTVNTPTSACVAMSVDGPNGGWGISMASNTASDCGWGFMIDGSVEIRNAALGHVKFTGSPTYDPNIILLYENDAATITYTLASDGSSRYTPASAVIKYDLVSNVVGAALYVAPPTLTVATAKQFEAVSFRPGTVTVNGTGQLMGMQQAFTISSANASSNTIGYGCQVLSAGGGALYGVFVTVGGTTTHTGTVIGCSVATTMVAGTVSAVVYDAVFDGAAGTYVNSAAFRARGQAAGDKALYGYMVDGSANITGAAFYYDMRSGNTGDFLNMYNEAAGATRFQVTSAGDIKVWGTGRFIEMENMASGTHNLRPYFRNLTTNGNTILGLIPNGTATTSTFRALSNSDASVAQSYSAFGTVGSITIIDSNVINSGSQGTMELRIGGTAKITINASGNTTIAGTLTQTGNATFTGDIIAIRGQTTTFPAANASGILTNDGSGTLSWETVTGTSQSQEYTSGSGNFSVPDGVSLVYVTGIGAGGAGGGTLSSATTGAGGGGSGEHGIAIPVIVTPSSTVAYSVGAKGTGTSGGAGTAGGDTTFGSLTFKGGSGGAGANTRTSGAGGGAGGGAATGTGVGNRGTLEAVCSFGGGSGGAGGTGAAGNGLAGAASTFTGGTAGTAGGSQSGGGGGASTPWGAGGAGGAGGANGGNAAAGCYGAGGGGSGGKASAVTGGDGIGGYLLITWVA